MNKLCKNCNHVVENNFCGNCGQSVRVGKLNADYLIEEFQHTVLHADKGIFYTIRNLFLNPANTIRNYIKGKRMGIFKPFGFLIILATINGFLSHVLNITYIIDFSGFANLDEESMKEVRNNYAVIYEWMYNHYSLFSLVSIIPLSFLSFVILKKSSGYNFVEQLVVNAYVLGQQCFISILLVPLSLLFSANIYFEVTSILTSLYFVWVYVKLFKVSSFSNAILKSLIVLILYYIALLMTSLLAGLVWGLTM